MNKAIYWLMAVFAVVKLLVMALRYHLLDWDEAVYLAMSRHIWSGGELGLFELFRPLALPLVIPFGSIAAADLLILVFSLGNLYLAYLLGKEIGGERAGLFSAVLLAVSQLFFYYSLKIYTGIPTMFFVLLSIYLLGRKSYALCGLSAGIAFLFRFPAGLILPVLLVVNKKSWKQAGLILLAFAVAVFPYLAFSQLAYGDFLFTLKEASVHQDNEFFAVEGWSKNLLYYPFVLFYPFPVLLLGLVGLYYYSRKMNPALFALLLYLAYFTWIANKQPRFALMMLPFVAILAGYGIVRLFGLARGRWTYAGGIVIGLGLLFAVSQNVVNVYSMPGSEPAIVSEYCLFPYKGTVLTTDPGPAVYSDASFVPVYMDVETAFEALGQPADMYILYPDVLPCYDYACNATRKALFDRLGKTELLYSGHRRTIYNITK